MTTKIVRMNYSQAEEAATKRATTEHIDVPIYRLYKSGKYTIDKPDADVEHTVHGTIAAG